MDSLSRIRCRPPTCPAKYKMISRSYAYDTNNIIYEDGQYIQGGADFIVHKNVLHIFTTFPFVGIHDFFLSVESFPFSAQFHLTI